MEPGESVEEAVLRELREETGLSAQIRGLVGVYSAPGRDPRGPTASVVFRVGGRPARPRGGDDAREARWVSLEEARPLAFDHDEILRDARRRRPR